MLTSSVGMGRKFSILTLSFNHYTLRTMLISSVGMGGNFNNFSKCLCSTNLKAQITKSMRDGTTHLVFCHGQVQIINITGI
ncbi:hypothetical protein Hanom_Chr02g00113891 [Helianthus anomalus]